MKPIAQSDSTGFNIGTSLVDACEHAKYKKKNKNNRVVIYRIIFAFVLSTRRAVGWAEFAKPNVYRVRNIANPYGCKSRGRRWASLRSAPTYPRLACTVAVARSPDKPAAHPGKGHDKKTTAVILVLNKKPWMRLCLIRATCLPIKVGRDVLPLHPAPARQPLQRFQ